jgi:enolase-phosphatase E1
MQVHVRGILLDIEGTTSSVSFVFDVMFPFVRRELAGWLEKNWGSADCSQVVEQMAKDAGHASAQAWLSEDPAEGKQQVIAEVTRLMDADVKATGLKMLQGMIWESGFASGELTAQVYDDVPVALKAWNVAGFDVRIYSSGSVTAQKLFFGHTIFGDLLPQFRGHYDTQIGGKKEAESYRQIAKRMELQPREILFVSDIVAELDAAKAAGMQTVLGMRPGNAAAPENHGHPAVRSFAEIECVRS